jgi:glutamate--cysteine ligase
VSTHLGGSTADAEPVTHAGLIRYFEAGAKPRGDWKIGGEFEKFLLARDTGRQLGHADPGGAGDVLMKLAERFGWDAHLDAGHLVALSRNGATVSVEPGGQLEFSTPPLRRISELEAALYRHRDELRAVVGPEVAVAALGVTPVSRTDDIPFGPRTRHLLMAEYLPKRSRTAHQMMKATASTQVTFDYADETDAARKMAVALTLGPVVNAIWGNGGVTGGKGCGWASRRGHVWLGMDPDRSGTLPRLLAGGVSFRAWTDYLLDVPMFFHLRHGAYAAAGGRTFRDFLNHGIDGEFPTRADWESHITTVFPEVRLKQFLEIRGADANPPALALAVPAIWSGLLYNDDALAAAEAVAARFPPAELPPLFEATARDGLAASFAGRSVREWASELAVIARDGLRADGEGAYLDPVFAILEAGVSPGGAWRARGAVTVTELLTANGY